MSVKAYFFETQSTSAWLRRLHVAAVVLLLSLVIYFIMASLAYYKWDWQVLWQYRARLLEGWCMTVVVSFFSLILSTLIGLVAALGQLSSVLSLQALCRIYVTLIRGTPLLAQILLLYYGIFEAVGLQSATLGGIVILSIFSGAYISEMIRAGILSVGESQRESARAVGFTTLQTYRFVILPQALRQTLPPLAGQFASLIKDSSLLMIIAVNEFTLAARDVSSLTYTAFESYLPLALGYLILTLPIFWLSESLERRLRYED